jgi:Zn-dependent peptidase ImmA (M78 family)
MTKPMHAKRHGKDLAETEANWFASGFLMPKSFFLEDMKIHRDDEEGYDIKYLAAKYWVSYKAADIRVKSLKVLV